MNSPGSILIVRHAQSAANVGLRTRDPETIPITDAGIVQANKLAGWMENSPTLIVTSRFVRTAQTAAPIVTRYPTACREQWTIHEFTYLSPERFVDTSMEERRPHSESYWTRSDPSFVHGAGAESLAVFVERARDLMTRLTSLHGERVVVVTHGQVMQAVMFLLAGNSVPATADEMRAYRAFTMSIPVANTAVLPLECSEDGLRCGVPGTAHLEEHEVTY